jgi:hypothetical protein
LTAVALLVTLLFVAITISVCSPSINWSLAPDPGAVGVREQFGRFPYRLRRIRTAHSSDNGNSRSLRGVFGLTTTVSRLRRRCICSDTRSTPFLLAQASVGNMLSQQAGHRRRIQHLIARQMGQVAPHPG